MIFSADNDDDIPTWRLILKDKKTVTRRLKPIKVGSIIAVQPNRAKKQVCKIRITRCEPHLESLHRLFLEKAQQQPIKEHESYGEIIRVHYRLILELLKEEAEKEGFRSFLWLWAWFKEHDININKTYRIEFKRLN